MRLGLPKWDGWSEPPVEPEREAVQMMMLTVADPAYFDAVDRGETPAEALRRAVAAVMRSAEVPPAPLPVEPSGEALQAADEAFDNWPEFTPAVQARLERALRAAYAVDFRSSGEGLHLSRVEAQRDRLVEALKRIVDHGKTHEEPCWALHNGDCADVFQEIARSALASLGDEG